jgi:hypothetical protein
MRPGTLRLVGITSMSIDSPDPRYRFSTDDGVYVGGGFGAYPGDPEPPDDGMVRRWFLLLDLEQQDGVHREGLRAGVGGVSGAWCRRSLTRPGDRRRSRVPAAL